MEEISLILAEQNDSQIIADILNEAMAYKLAHSDKAWGTESWTAKEITENIEYSPYYLIKQNDEIVGTVSIQWQDERVWGEQLLNAAYIHKLAIKNDFHGQNLGSKIINAIADLAKEQGKEYLRLDCEASNTQLCKYYEDQGFTKIDTKLISSSSEYTAALYERPININS